MVGIVAPSELEIVAVDRAAPTPRIKRLFDIACKTITGDEPARRDCAAAIAGHLIPSATFEVTARQAPSTPEAKVQSRPPSTHRVANPCIPGKPRSFDLPRKVCCAIHQPVIGCHRAADSDHQRCHACRLTLFGQAKATARHDIDAPRLPGGSRPSIQLKVQIQVEERTKTYRSGLSAGSAKQRSRQGMEQCDGH